MILSINIPTRNYYSQSFKRISNEIPEELMPYKEKPRDFAFYQINGLTCPSCGASMFSEGTFDRISEEISTSNPQQCSEILKKYRKYMIPSKRNIYDVMSRLKDREPNKSMFQILNDIDANDNEQTLQAQINILRRMGSVAKRAGDKKLVEQQKAMFARLKKYSSSLYGNEKELYKDILFFYEDQIKTKKHPIPPGKLASKIKNANFENDDFTNQVVASIDKSRDYPEYEMFDIIASALGHLSDIVESRKQQKSNQATVEKIKGHLLSEELKKLEQIRAIAGNLNENEAFGVNAVVDKAFKKIAEQQSTMGRKAFLNEINQLGISSPVILKQITEIVNTKIEDSHGYRTYIIPQKTQQGLENATYSFSREALIGKISAIKLQDEKLKNLMLKMADELPSAKTEKKYIEIKNLVDMGRRYKEPEVTKVITSAFLSGSVANTDHFEAVRGENRGLDILTNYIGMHKDCNCRKQNKLPYLWFQENPKRAIYLKKHLGEVQRLIDRGDIADGRYTNYTSHITNAVLASTGGKIDLMSIPEV